MGFFDCCIVRFEAYLRGIETSLSCSIAICRCKFEAYLRGIETLSIIKAALATATVFEAYLRGIET